MNRCPLCSAEIVDSGHVCSRPLIVSKSGPIVPIEEKFDEVFEDRLWLVGLGDKGIRDFDEYVRKYIGNDRHKVRVSCKQGKIVIERVD